MIKIKMHSKFKRNILMLLIGYVFMALNTLNAGQIYTENGFFHGLLYKLPFMLTTSISETDWLKITFPIDMFPIEYGFVAGLDLDILSDSFILSKDIINKVISSKIIINTDDLQGNPFFVCLSHSIISNTWHELAIAIEPSKLPKVETVYSTPILMATVSESTPDAIIYDFTTSAGMLVIPPPSRPAAALSIDYGASYVKRVGASN